MGSPAESFEKKNIFLKNSDEIRRLDGTVKSQIPDTFRTLKQILGVT
jgi:hypothetical protein